MRTADDFRAMWDTLERLWAETIARARRLPESALNQQGEPRLVGQIGFTEWTEDGQLRHPRFHGLRDDKDPQEVGREA